MPRSKPLPSRKGDRNALTTAPIEPALVETNEPTQEMKMEASTNPAAPQAEPTKEVSAGVTELTARQMADAEEANAARAKKIIDLQQEKMAEAATQQVSIIGLAAQGREALLEELRKHNERAKKPEHVPAPRTPLQMANLNAELAAGAAARQKAEEQLAFRPTPTKPVNEGFTTPVYRPGDFVPDLNSKDPATK